MSLFSRKDQSNLRKNATNNTDFHTQMPTIFKCLHLVLVNYIFLNSYALSNGKENKFYNMRLLRHGSF